MLNKCTSRDEGYSNDENKVLITRLVQKYKPPRRRNIVYDQGTLTLKRIIRDYPGFDGKARRMAKCILTGDKSINSRTFDLPRSHPAVHYLLDHYLEIETAYDRDPIDWKYGNDIEFIKQLNLSTKRMTRKEKRSQKIISRMSYLSTLSNEMTSELYNSFEKIYKKFRGHPDSEVGYTTHTMKYATMMNCELISAIQRHMTDYARINYLKTFPKEGVLARTVDGIKERIYSLDSNSDPYLTPSFIKYVSQEKMNYYQEWKDNKEALEKIWIGKITANYEEIIVQRGRLVKGAKDPDKSIVVRRSTLKFNSQSDNNARSVKVQSSENIARNVYLPSSPQVYSTEIRNSQNQQLHQSVQRNNEGYSGKENRDERVVIQ